MFRTWKSADGQAGSRVPGSSATGSSRRGKRRVRRINSLEWLEDRTLLSTYVVSSTADSTAAGTLPLPSLR